jgi:hypothetical protein
MSEERITIDQVPKVKHLQEEFGEGLTEYIWNDDFE